MGGCLWVCMFVGELYSWVGVCGCTLVGECLWVGGLGGVCRCMLVGGGLWVYICR